MRQEGDDIFAIAAHLYGLSIQHRRHKLKIAERAFRESIAANRELKKKAHVWHSLANLLAKDRKRRTEAEEAYKESLAGTEDDPVSRGERLHSYGNLLAEDDRRWPEAEAAYQESLELRVSKRDKAQTLADWARLLVRVGSIEGDERAEEYALKALKLDPNNPKTSGICYQVLADIYEARGEISKAIWSLEGVMATDRKQGKKQFEKELQHKINNLHRLLQK